MPRTQPEEDGHAPSWGDTIKSPSNYSVPAVTNAMQEEYQSEHLRASDLVWGITEGFVEVVMLELGWEGWQCCDEPTLSADM